MIPNIAMVSFDETNSEASHLNVTGTTFKRERERNFRQKQVIDERAYEEMESFTIKV